MTRQTQLITGDHAMVTKKQHKSPCSDCPFARKSIRGWLGLMSPQDWMALAHGEGKADCHTQRGPNGPWDCAGLAIYRANVCKSPRDPIALRLPANQNTVFATQREFLEHHLL